MSNRSGTAEIGLMDPVIEREDAVDHRLLQDAVESTDWDNLSSEALNDVADAAIDDIKEKFGSVAEYMATLDVERGRVEDNLEPYYEAHEFTDEMLRAAPPEKCEEFTAAVYRRVIDAAPDGTAGETASREWTYDAYKAINESQVALGHSTYTWNLIDARLQQGAEFYKVLEQENSDTAQQMQRIMDGEKVQGIAEWLQNDEQRAEGSRLLGEFCNEGEKYSPETHAGQGQYDLTRGMLVKSLGEIHEEIERLRQPEQLSYTLATQDTPSSAPEEYDALMQQMIAAKAAEANIAVTRVAAAITTQRSDSGYPINENILDIYSDMERLIAEGPSADDLLTRDGSPEAAAYVDAIAGKLNETFADHQEDAAAFATEALSMKENMTANEWAISKKLMADNALMYAMTQNGIVDESMDPAEQWAAIDKAIADNPNGQAAVEAMYDGFDAQLEEALRNAQQRANEQRATAAAA